MCFYASYDLSSSFVTLFSKTPIYFVTKCTFCMTFMIDVPNIVPTSNTFLLIQYNSDCHNITSFTSMRISHLHSCT